MLTVIGWLGRLSVIPFGGRRRLFHQAFWHRPDPANFTGLFINWPMANVTSDQCQTTSRHPNNSFARDKCHADDFIVEDSNDTSFAHILHVYLHIDGIINVTLSKWLNPFKCNHKTRFEYFMRNAERLARRLGDCLFVCFFLHLLLHSFSLANSVRKFLGRIFSYFSVVFFIARD